MTLGPPTDPGAVWPRVTAIVPTHDRPILLKRSIASILAQDYQGEIECIAVFDRQQPNLPDLVIPKGRMLMAVANGRTPGLAGSRNTGADAASGDLLAFCDDDDEWLPSKLRLQVEALRGSPGASAATCGIYVVTNKRAVRRMPPGATVSLDDLARSRQMAVHSSTIVTARDRFLGEIGLIDEAIPGSYGEDYDWLLRAARVGPLVVVRQPLVRVHWATSYFSDQWQMMILGLQFLLDKHPELSTHPKNLSRMYGQLAFAYSAAGDRSAARSFARRSISLNRRQARGYLAYLVTWGLSPKLVKRAVNAVGRGL